jgi:hypothetical protein
MAHYRAFSVSPYIGGKRVTQVTEAPVRMLDFRLPGACCDAYESWHNPRAGEVDILAFGTGVYQSVEGSHD